VDVFTDFDFGQDISSDTDGDLDTDGDFGDPDFGRDTNGDTDPTDPTPRDRRDFDPGDNGRRDRDPIVELEDDAGTDDEQRVFGAAAVDDLIDSGLQSGSDAFEDLFGGSR